MGSYFWWRATARANGETCRSLGIGHPKRLIINAILLILAIVVIKFIGVTGQMNEEWRWAVAVLVASTTFYIPMFVWNLFKAPGHMEKEADKVHKQEFELLYLKTIEQKGRIAKLEEERIPKFAIHHTSGKSIMGDRNELSSWAELKIRNTSTIVDIADVKVKIVALMRVYEEQDEKGVGTGTYRLIKPYHEWEISSVIWSGRTDNPGEIRRTIHPNETECTTIAYNLKNRNDVAVFNVRNFPSVWESRITIEVSGTGSNTWQGVYYIEYHPPIKDEFEFVEWTEWLKTHELIEP